MRRLCSIKGFFKLFVDGLVQARIQYGVAQAPLTREHDIVVPSCPLRILANSCQVQAGFSSFRVSAPRFLSVRDAQFFRGFCTAGQCGRDCGSGGVKIF